MEEDKKYKEDGKTKGGGVKKWLWQTVKGVVMEEVRSSLINRGSLLEC